MIDRLSQVAPDLTLNGDSRLRRSPPGWRFVHVRPGRTTGRLLDGMDDHQLRSPLARKLGGAIQGAVPASTEVGRQ